MRQQIQLSVKERFHVEMTMSLQYLGGSNLALVLIRVELKHRFDILGNGPINLQRSKSMVGNMRGIDACCIAQDTPKCIPSHFCNVVIS